jgi:glycosyltransferase involved in cell wall biosynthesis
MSVYQQDNADHLRRALTSIYEDQTRKPDEIVVVFDGPLTEELHTVLSDYARDKADVVRYLPQTVNCGLGEALRVGSEQCAGDYILRMDADDISHPQRIERQATYLERHPEVDVLGADIAEFYESPDETKLRVRACPAEHSDIVSMGKKRNPMNHVTACIKKDALMKSGGYETLLLLEDYYLWLKMIAAGCVFANINESLVYVRIGNGFHTNRGSKVRIQGWKFLQQFMLEHGMITKSEARINMLCIRAFVYFPSRLRKWVYDYLLRK